MIGTIQNEVVLSEDFDCRLRREVVGVAVVSWVGVEAVVSDLLMPMTLWMNGFKW